ncbi:glycoside hydrolase superfamily [Xylariaceae sp. FL0804]|nr:glycoside hydrolase superfamily [Xylariaceae sp. FL0804]
MKSPLYASSAALVLAAASRANSIYPDCQNGPAALTSNLVCDTSASPAARAAALVAAMPLSDKLQNLVDQSNGSAKLGLAPYEWWSEGLHGVASSPGVDFADEGEAYSSATSFPEPILMSAAFDDAMIRAVASVVGTEARAFSNHQRAGLDFWTPNINPYRDPRWGRGMETPGESPFRTRGYVKHLLEGLEEKTDNGIKKIIATCKHFAGYDLENWEGNLRYGFDAKILPQDLAGYYLPPFQQCARDSQVGSIIYNAVNGVPACDSSYLMGTILREHWGWTVDNQYITSDCNAVDDTFTNHNYTSSLAEAAGVAYNAGTDTVCILTGQLSDVTGAYDQGILSEEVIDGALRRLFQGLVILGYFDPPADNPYRAYDWSNVNTPYAQNLAREVAAKSLVLLKNDGFLPHQFSKSQKVAMIGMWANGTTQMQGNYEGVAPYLHSPLYAAEQLGIDYTYANGPIGENFTMGNWTEPIAEATEGADIILYFGGIDTTLEAEASDRYEINWPPSQLAVIEDVCALGKPCVVVQMGDQVDDSPLLSNPNVSAIVWAGYPGQDGGPAVFDVLTGATAPAGRLPVTQYPADYVNQVAMTDMLLTPGPNNPGRTHLYYADPVLPFGYGLHYTKFKASFATAAASARTARGASSVLTNGSSFDIGALVSSCTEQHKDLCPFPAVTVAVRNQGNVTSDFAALVFVRTTDGGGPGPHPLKQLAGYARLASVRSGAAAVRTASIALELGSLAARDALGNLVLHPGTYELLLDVPTQATLRFALTGAPATLEAWPQPPARETYEAAQECPDYGPCPWQPVTPEEAKGL